MNRAEKRRAHLQRSNANGGRGRGPLGEMNKELETRTSQTDGEIEWVSGKSHQRPDSTGAKEGKRMCSIGARRFGGNCKVLEPRRI